MIGAQEMSYQVRLQCAQDEAIERVTEALAAEGFGVLTRIDVQSTLKEKLDVDFRPYVILGACNPPLAHRALAASVDIGLLLPCNVVVYEDGDGSMVKILDPGVMLGMAQIDGLTDLAEEAAARLERVAGSLSG